MNPWIPHLLRAGGGGGGPVLPPAGRTMLANLTSSLILDEGTGGPTWSRATKAWGFNELGYLEEIASGCAFFGGARLVRNLLAATEDASSGSWSKTAGTTAAQATDSAGGSTAIRFTYGSSQSSLMWQNPTVTNRTATYCLQFRFKTDATHDWWRAMIYDGSGNQCRAWFNAQTGVLGTVNTAGSGVVVAATLTNVGGGWFALRLVGSSGIAGTGSVYAQFSANDGDGSTLISSVASGDAITIEKPSLVDVTNYDASYIPEYVSVGSDTDKNFLLHTDDFSQAAWSKTNVTITQASIANPVNGRVDAQKIEATAGAVTSQHQSVSNCGSTTGNIFTFYVKQGSGETDANRFVIRNNTTATDLLSIRINYSTGAITYVVGSSGVTMTDVGSGWWKVTMVVTSGVSNNDTIWTYIAFAGAAETAGEFCYIYRPYLGRGTTAPAVLPAVAGVWDPFGAGIDGAKYFETDWQGAPIAAANLLRVRREALAINNLLQSRLFQSNVWSSSPTGSELCVNGDFGASTGWTAEAGWAIGAGVLTATATSANTYRAAGIISGKTYTVSFEVVSRTAGLVAVTVGNQPVAVWRSTAGVYTYNVIGGSSGNIEVKSSGFSGVVDNVSVKEAAVQCTQATGLDGIANTATTLTATVADAIILQPTSGIASAARCASAYVKRRTGTGTISFTQDGGSTWTDITAQINSSTWSRVEITATLANPSVGFKISTSGDAIDVDCAQNEAGAVATSPIVTTTAAITRNADSLSYQTAGNIDFAVGTIYCEVQSTPTGSNRNAVAPGNSSCNASNSSSTSWRAFDGTTVVEKTGLSDISTGKRKRANSWGPANTKVTGDGLTPASGAFDGLFGDGAILYIAQNFQGYIGPVAIYNYQMTDAELQAITT